MEREIDDYHTLPDIDDSQKLIVVTEAYLHIDLNQDGIAELAKITYTGESHVDEILDIEESLNFPLSRCLLMPNPHRFIGTSILTG